MSVPWRATTTAWAHASGHPANRGPIPPRMVETIPSCSGAATGQPSSSAAGVMFVLIEVTYSFFVPLISHRPGFKTAPDTLPDPVLYESDPRVVAVIDVKLVIRY